MNQIAVLSGKSYRLLELLPGVDAHSYVLCESEDGQRYVCPLEQWEAAAPPPAARIHSKSPAEEIIKLFMELFHGRDDVYAHRWYNRITQKSGYAPACRNEWAWGVCDKKKVRCVDCPNREFIPLSPEIIRTHLIGRDEECKDVAGIYPLLPYDTTRLLCVDFDDAGWQEDVSAEVKTMNGTIQRCAVIDKTLVWYGGISVLSHSRPDETAIRLESPELAGELLELGMEQE